MTPPVAASNASFCQNALADCVGRIPVLRLRLCWHLEGAEVVNIGSRLIPDDLIFRRGLMDIFKKKLNLAAIVSEVSQAAEIGPAGPVFPACRLRPVRAQIFEL